VTTISQQEDYLTISSDLMSTYTTMICGGGSSVTAPSMHAGNLTASTITLTGAGGSISTPSGAGSNWINTGTINGTISSSSSHFNNGSGKSIMSIPHGEDKVIIEKEAELEVQGRVKINGEYLHERLERIETLLNIPSRDITMEHKYPKLKELWESYNRELAKYKTWDKLKDSE